MERNTREGALQILNEILYNKLVTPQVYSNALRLFYKLEEKGWIGGKYPYPNIGTGWSDEEEERNDVMEFFWTTPYGFYIIINASSFELIMYELREEIDYTLESFDNMIERIDKLFL